MALNASMNWWVRAGGSASNGGGFDAAVAGAGTNYADQDAAQVVFSAGNANRLSTSGAGATTVTSAGTPFTSAMVGNVIRISGGTNFQAGYYTVVTYTDASNVVLDRTPTSGGAGADGVGSLGGAFATPWGNLSSGGSVTAPTLTTPLAAGHHVWVRGSGSINPGSADYTQTGYASYPAGSVAAGLVRFSGYNGRPRIDCNDIFVYQVSFHWYEGIVIVCTAGGNPANGRFEGTTSGVRVAGCKIDQAGYDVTGIKAGGVFGCDLTNSGSTAAGVRDAIVSKDYATITGNRVNSWRGNGIWGTQLSSVVGNVVASCKGSGGGIGSSLASSAYSNHIEGNTVHGCAADGIVLQNANAAPLTVVKNNILSDNGGYGLRAPDTEALNDLRAFACDYNAYYNNASGETVNIANGDNDITLAADPFTNAAGGDYTLNNTAGGGADLKNVAFPTSIP